MMQQGGVVSITKPSAYLVRMISKLGKIHSKFILLLLLLPPPRVRFHLHANININKSAKFLTELGKEGKVSI